MRFKREDIDLLAEAYDDVMGPRDMGSTEDAEDLESAFHRAAGPSIAYVAGKEVAMKLGSNALEDRKAAIEQFIGGYDSIAR
jgi:hypothetical protein